MAPAGVVGFAADAMTLLPVVDADGRQVGILSRWDIAATVAAL